jgi:hypothetical protein
MVNLKFASLAGNSFLLLRAQDPLYTSLERSPSNVPA